MKNLRKKHGLSVVTGEVYNLDPNRYQLRKGTLRDAPPCPFGHRFKWIGFDGEKQEYVRVTKSVFKRLIKQIDPDVVAEYERDFKASAEAD